MIYTILCRAPIIDQLPKSFNQKLNQRRWSETKFIFGKKWNHELCIHYLELQTASNSVFWNSII